MESELGQRLGTGLAPQTRRAREGGMHFLMPIAPSCAHVLPLERAAISPDRCVPHEWAKSPVSIKEFVNSGQWFEAMVAGDA